MRRSRINLGLFLMGLAAGTSLAVAPRPLAAQLPSPPISSEVIPHGAEALWANPAAMPWVNDWAAMGGAQTPTDSWSPALYGAAITSLPFGLGLGVGGAREETARGVATAVYSALGFAPSRRLSLGSTGLIFRPPEAQGLRFDYDIHATWRPSQRWALAAHARGLWSAWRGTHRSRPSEISLGILLRPYANPTLEAEMGLNTDLEGRLGMRALLGIRIPRFGEVRFGWESQDSGERVEHEGLLSLRVAYDQGAITSGFRSSRSSSASDSVFGALSLQGTSQPGIPPRSFVRELTLRGEMSPRKMIGWAQVLDRSLHDPRVVGVLLRIQGASLPIAYAQELRLQIQSLQSAGKRVVCAMNDPSGPEAYVCAAADSRILDPAGMVRWTGVSSRRVLLGGAMERLGVRADFLRIGRFKDAPEPLTNRESSASSVEQRRVLTDDIANRMSFDISEDLGIAPAAAGHLLRDGPHLAEAALEARVVTDLHDTSQLANATEIRGQGDSAIVASPTPRERPLEASSAPIGVVVIDENIVDGRNVDIPLVDVHATGGDTVVEAIEGLARDPAVKVIILRIDSPGGAAFASDQIWRAVRRARRSKPVLASLGRVAASGGYYVACAADEIWTNPSTVTGSIGILMGKVDIAPLAARLGIRTELDASSPRAGALSLWAPFTSEQRGILADLIRAGYRRFLDRVAEGRQRSRAWVHARAQGRVWSGDAALREGLVDRLGGFASVLQRARQIAELPADARVTVLPRRPSSLVDYLLSGTSVRATAAIRQGLNRWWSVLRSDEMTPLALLPEEQSW